MKEKKGEKGRFAGRSFIRTSLIVVAGIIMAAALLAGSCSVAIHGCRGPNAPKTDKVGASLGHQRASRHGRRGLPPRNGDAGGRINGRGGFSGERLNSSNTIRAANPKKPCAGRGNLRPIRVPDFLFAHGSSAESFAVGAVSREIKKVIFVTERDHGVYGGSKSRSPYCFRSATNTLLINVAGAQYAAKKSRNWVLPAGTR